MSISFEWNEQEIWSPSLRVGQLFLKQVILLEQLVDHVSGFDAHVNDVVEINEHDLAVFVDKVLHMLEMTNNGTFLALVSGCFQVILALNARIKGQWPSVPPRLEPLIASAKTILQATY
jgi:hypothetical protein